MLGMDRIVRMRPEAVIEEATPWWADRPRGPLVLRGFFDPAVADMAAGELAACESWAARHAVLDEAGAVSPATRAEFQAARPRRRYYSCDVMEPDTLTTMPACAKIGEVLRGGWLAEVCGGITGVSLKPQPWMNVSRYRRGSFLGGHNDVHDDRLIGAILYLNRPDYAAGAGGEFFMRAPDGDIALSGPFHNTLALIPFRAELFHGVTPVRDPEFTRHAIGAHFMSLAEGADDRRR